MISHIRVRTKAYRGDSGFSVSWRDARIAWPQAVFLKKADQALTLAEALKRGESAQRTLERIWFPVV
jgi:hypothetical protein